MTPILQRVWKDESAATLIEYSVLIALITAASIAIVMAAGRWAGTQWTVFPAALGI